MENSKNNYHISFFRPTTKRATRNRNMVLWLICIWAIAIFGFQSALYVIERPTPEASLIQFENVWDQVKTNTANPAELQKFAYASLSVLGKVFIQPQHKTSLGKGLSWAVFQLADSAQKEDILAEILQLKGLASKISDIRDLQYQQSKKQLSNLVSPLIGLEKTDVRRTILPLELIAPAGDGFSEEDKALIKEAMYLYLLHNQSVLTDTKFLGFPFHYFYTAIFLLVLFVGLCWVYCVRTDKINAKLNIAD